LINQNQEAEANLEDIKEKTDNDIKKKLSEVVKNRNNLDFLINKSKVTKFQNQQSMPAAKPTDGSISKPRFDVKEISNFACLNY
jgi:hypothetical protein